MDKVLVIEDDRGTRRVVTRAIEKLGLCCIESANGRHGWETLCENDAVSIVITDMMMPDMDGRELIYLIRRDNALTDIPVVIMTSLAEEEVSNLKELAPGNTYFLQKPIQLPKLIGLMKQFKEALES